MRRTVKQPLFKVFLYVVFALFIFWICFPFLWLVFSSIVNVKELGAVPPHWIPKEPTLNNFRAVFSGNYNATAETGYNDGTWQGRTGILNVMFNSFYIAGLVALLNVLVGGLAAYSISRFRTTLNRSLYLVFLGSRVLPPMALVMPFFIVFKHLGLINTPWALIISYNLFILPLSIWLLKVYFDKVPADVEEMSLIDGLNRYGALFRIIIPMAIPGFVAVFIMSMLESWSEFFYALVLTDQMTVPPLLIEFRQTQQVLWNQQAAASVLAVLPPLVVVLVLQNRIVSGLTAGAVKG